MKGVAAFFPSVRCFPFSSNPIFFTKDNLLYSLLKTISCYGKIIFMIYKVSQALKKNMWAYIVGPSFKIIEAVFDLLIPLFMKAVLDLSFSSDPKTIDPISKALGNFIALFGQWVPGNEKLSYALVGGFIILLMGIIGLGTTMVCQYIAALAATRSGTDLRDALYKKILGLDKKTIEAFGQGKTQTILNSDSFQVQQGVLFFIRLGIRAPFIILGSLVFSFILDWHIGLVFLGIVPIILLIVFKVMRKASRQYLVIQGRLDHLSSMASDNLDGARVVRAFSTEAIEKNRFANATDEYQKEAIHVSKINALINPLTFAIVSLATILVVLLGGFDMSNGVMFLGSPLQSSTIITLVSYLSQIFQTLVLLTNLVTIFTKSIVSWKRCDELFALQPTIVDKEDAKKKSIPVGEEIFSFDNVSLSYEEGGNAALRDISFMLKKGQTLGIIGGTGSGKTTLIRLIERLLDRSSGTVCYKGIDIKDYSLKALHSEIAYVPQKSVLFKGTIRSNLQMSKEDCTDKDIEEALDLACAKEFVSHYEDGFDHEVEEGGKNFSGGQRQRLCIARGLIRKPEVLILDDSTSALDLLTDRTVRHNIASALPECTKILVSQRVSTIKDADEILVLEGGKIIGKGRHDELLESCPIYLETYQSQMQKGE